MAPHLVRVYFRTFLAGETHPDEISKKEPDVEDGWRERVCMEFVHDTHAKFETLRVAQQTDEAVHAALQERHPNMVIVLDKISWLEEAVD